MTNSSRPKRDAVRDARDLFAVGAIVAVWLLFYWRLFTPIVADRVQFPLESVS